MPTFRPAHFALLLAGFLLLAALLSLALSPSITHADDPPTPTATSDPCALPGVTCTDGRVQDSEGK